MSVHEIVDPRGSIIGYRVRWRPSPTANASSKTFPLKPGRSAAQVKQQAIRFEATQLAARESGAMTTDRGRQTLREFGLEYKARYADIEQTKRTRQTNASLWNNHVLPHLGDYKLTDLAASPEIVQGWKAKLVRNGVGDGAIRRTLAVLSGVMQKAVEWNRIPQNPVRGIRRPSGRRKRHVTALPTLSVEAMRATMNHRDATLVSVLAYCGLRPGEALALRWADIRERTVLVNKAISLGVEGSTKTGQVRSAELPEPVRDDLAAWKKASGVQVGLIFPGHDGKPWTDTAIRNWRSRVWQPAAVKAGLATITETDGKRSYEGPRPYDLRHSCASYMLRANDDLLYVASRMGHSLKILSDTYAHEIAEVSGQPRQSMDDQIQTARVSRVSENGRVA